MSSEIGALLTGLAPIGLATLVFLAVGAVAMLMVHAMRGGANRAILAAMPRYEGPNRLRSAHPTNRGAQASAQSGVAETAGSGLLLRLANMVTGSRYRSWLRAKLADVGFRGAVALRAQLVKKASFAIGGAFFGLLFLTKGPALGIGAVLLLATLAFFVPDLLLISEGQKRVESLDRGLPDAIDLLNLCVESGLSFENAIGRVSVSLDGPVAEEFGALISDLQLGKSRTDALTGLAERTQSKGLKRFLSALLQVDRLGVPIAGVLAEQADEMRAVRKDRAREKGQQVTIKILMPLMFCFLPAMFVIVLGPAIVQLVKTMSLL